MLIIILLLLHMGLASSSPAWFFPRRICTGLGDRIGTWLTLASLARLQNATVFTVWCHDPSFMMPEIRVHIPEWHGYTYSIPDLHSSLGLPAEIVILHNDTGLGLPNVTEGHAAPAIAGFDAVYTIAWQTMRLGSDPVDASLYAGVYREVTRPMLARAAMKMGNEGYTAVHIRGPDDNTYAFANTKYQFCTRKVLIRLRRMRARLLVVTNNVSWTVSKFGSVLPPGSLDYVPDPLEDWTVLLGASAIVQHAWEGWSAYSSVAAMAGGIPLLTTYSGSLHRYDAISRYGRVPEEFYTCSRMNEFFMLHVENHREVEDGPVEI